MCNTVNANYISGNQLLYLNMSSVNKHAVVQIVIYYSLSSENQDY